MTDLTELIEAIAVAVQRWLVTLDEARARAERLGAFRGSARLCQALNALEGRRTDSTAERSLLKELTAAGIPPDATLYPVHDRAGRLVACWTWRI